MDLRVGAVIALVALAGCASAPPPAAAPAPAPTPDLAPVSLDAPNFLDPVNLGRNGRAAEPAIAVGPDGTVYVAAAPQLWRSDDGRTFTALGESRCLVGGPVCPPGYAWTWAPLDGFRGGDSAIGVDAAGNLYFLGLQGETGQLPFHVSVDRGETWSEPFDLAGGNSSDRQWMKVLANGTVLATWRDFGPDDEGPRQMLFRRSVDGGVSWEPTRVIGPDPLIQGPLALTPSGAILTPFYDDAGMHVARSADGGATWAMRDVVLEERDTTLREGRPIDMFPSIAADEAGALYVAWAADRPEDSTMGSKDTTLPRVWLAVSTDEGETWSAPRAISPEGKVAAFPWIVAGKPGRIAVTWYEGRAGTPSQTAPDAWDVALVESVSATASEPEFSGGYANTAPTHVGGMCRSGGGCRQVCELPTLCVGQDRSRSEVFEMALREGQPILAWVADAQPYGTGIEIHVGGVESGTPIG